MSKDIILDVERGANPDHRRTKGGYVFDFNSDQWQLDGSICINLNRLRKTDERTKSGFRKALCRYAEEYSASYVESILALVNHYFKTTKEMTVNVVGLTNYLAALGKKDENKLGSVKAFYLSWYNLGFEGVDLDVVEYLDELRLKGADKGKVVSSRCPRRGPLTMNELGGIIDWASNSYSQDIISLTEYSFIMALAYTGRRPFQIRSIRGKDLVAREDKDGYDYVINCPRAKRKGGLFRGEFNPVTINEDLYLLLKNQWGISIKYFESRLSVKLSDSQKKEVPLYINYGRVDLINDFSEFNSNLGGHFDYFHMTKQEVTDLVHGISAKNTARSERTGEVIQFTAYRFRYTKGTNLSRRGVGGIALAMALDHSDMQHIGVYVENTEETAAQIDAVMAPMLAPLAQAFAGNLIATEKDAIRANDPHSRIKNNQASNVGNCGTYAFCASGYRACYTCCNFQPWLDASHEEVLEEVLEERKRQKEVGVSEFVIQASDRLLLAVQQVIQMCEKMKGKNRTEKGVLNG